MLEEIKLTKYLIMSPKVQTKIEYINAAVTCEFTNVGAENRIDVAIMTLHNFQSLIILSKACLFVISANPCSGIHLLKLVT